MTYSENVQTGAPLGVGAIISESFSILMRHFVWVVILAIVPTLIGIAISGMVNGWGVALGVGQPVYNSAADAVPFLLSIVVQFVTYGLTTALLVQLAYDAKLQRPLQPGRYVEPALGAAVPIAVLGFVAGLLTAIASIALILPGLWVYAVFSMMPAAVMIEKIGFGGLGRSAALTKEYRWPILGAMIVIGIINFVISFVAMFIVGYLIGSMGAGGGSIVIAVLAMSAITAIGYGLSSIAIALMYARLREIKEGATVRDIAAVFD